MIIYSTCSTNKEENEDIIYSTLGDWKIISLRDIKLDYGIPDKFIRVPRDKTDGFFVAAIENK